jgi:hypothetical protein
MRKLFLLICLLSVNLSHAEEYKLGDFSFKLPIPKEWLAKSGDKKGSLVFLNSKVPAPRPIISVYFSSFRYPSQTDLSAFEQRHISEKNEMVKKTKGSVVFAPKLEYITQEKSAISSFGFENEHGRFFELSRYEECNSEFSLVLKMIIPYEVWESDLGPYAQKYWQDMAKIRLCNKS